MAEATKLASEYKRVTVQALIILVIVKQTFNMKPSSIEAQLKAGLAAALSGSLANYAHLTGSNIISRLDHFYEWYSIRQQTGTWHYSRRLQTAPGTTISTIDAQQNEFSGINFASQDYLGLSAHPDVINAAREALLTFGPHGAGSPFAVGQSTITTALEEKLKTLTGMEHVMVYPTGWASGFGSIMGLVRKDDYIVIDNLAHACLNLGAACAARKHVYKFDHLDHTHLKQVLNDIRARDTINAILVVTEGIFSMNSDTPDLQQTQAICHEYNATLLVDVAHDLGSMGPGGTGQIGLQGMKGRVDFVMGSFSKCFASNGGFFATHSPAVLEYLKSFSSPYVFTNAISPVQAASVLQATKIITSAEGEERRQHLDRLSKYMRAAFEKKQQVCLGIPSAVVPVMVKQKSVARLIQRILPAKNIIAMIAEYPVVPLLEPRFRLQVMATHTHDQIITGVDRICEAIEEAEKLAGLIPH
jgi:7-keto-8-aminopelargonate synthetase-like enzyme